MSIFPSTKDEWMALLLFPFKAYAVIAYPFYLVFRIFCPQPFLGTMASDGTFETLLGGYALCIVVVFVGAIIQLVVSGKQHALNSLAYVVIPILAFGLLIMLRFH